MVLGRTRFFARIYLYSARISSEYNHSKLSADIQRRISSAFGLLWTRPRFGLKPEAPATSTEVSTTTRGLRLRTSFSSSFLLYDTQLLPFGCLLPICHQSRPPLALEQP